MRKTEIEETTMTDINKIENGPMLNLYPDSLGGDLEAVADLFERDGFADAFSSMYILPSIYHSDLDRGFSVIDYDLEETFHSEKALLRLYSRHSFRICWRMAVDRNIVTFLLTGIHSGKTVEK